MGLFQKIGDFIGSLEECADAIASLVKGLWTSYDNLLSLSDEEIRAKMAYGESLRACEEQMAKLQEEIELATNKSHVGAPQCSLALESARTKLAGAIVELEGLLEQFHRELK